MNAQIELTNPATIKAYFEKVRELAKQGNQYPVALDDVWPLIYAEKGKAVRVLRKDFFENEDFEVIAILGKNPNGGRPEIDYRLSVACMEHFVARKVKEVFEVYRKVFHRTADAIEAPTPVLSQIDILVQSVHILQAQQRQMDEMKAVQQEQAESIRQIEARTTTRPDYFTVAGYANLNNIQIGLQAASSVGQKASKICQQRGFPMETIPDPRFGKVRMYPRPVLAEVFAQPI